MFCVRSTDTVWEKVPLFNVTPGGTISNHTALELNKVRQGNQMLSLSFSLSLSLTHTHTHTHTHKD